MFFYLYMDKKSFIVICGPIGSGKTTVAKILHALTGFRVYDENIDNHPVLQNFYKDMKKHAYQLQIFLLGRRNSDHITIANSEEGAIQVRPIYEDYSIFAPHLHKIGAMTDEEYENYKTVFKIYLKKLPNPDLLVYLRTSPSVIKERIRARGLAYEKDMLKPDNTYLDDMHYYYEKFFEDYNISEKIVINTDNLDFKKNRRHIISLIEPVLQKIGMFNEE